LHYSEETLSKEIVSAVKSHFSLTVFFAVSVC